MEPLEGHANYRYGTIDRYWNDRHSLLNDYSHDDDGETLSLIQCDHRDDDQRMNGSHDHSTNHHDESAMKRMSH